MPSAAQDGVAATPGGVREEGLLPAARPPPDEARGGKAEHTGGELHVRHCAAEDARRGGAVEAVAGGAYRAITPPEDWARQEAGHRSARDAALRQLASCSCRLLPTNGKFRSLN